MHSASGENNLGTRLTGLTRLEPKKSGLGNFPLPPISSRTHGNCKNVCFS